MSTIRISTNFNIDLGFEAAPFHRRLFAWFFDLLVLAGYCFIVYKILDVFDGGSSFSSETWTVVLMLLIIPFALYHLICEIILKGQSVGKRIMGLRVVNEDGGRPSVGQFIIRWFIRTSDYMILLIAIYAPVGFGGDASVFWQIAAAFCLLIANIILVNTSKKGQRLGDILAHTLLIRTAQKAAIEDTIFLDVQDNYTPRFPQVMQLSDRDINALKGILDASKKSGDYNLADRASEKVKSHLHIESQLSAYDFLEILLKDYNYLSAH